MLNLQESLNEYLNNKEEEGWKVEDEASADWAQVSRPDYKIAITAFYEEED